MDAFVGNWKAGPNDLENMGPHFEAMNLSVLTEAYKNGVEVSVFKDGENYVINLKGGNAPVTTQIFYPDGVVKCPGMPEGQIQMNYKLEGGQIKTQGRFGDGKTEGLHYIKDGKYIGKSNYNGVPMTTTLSRV